MTNIDHGFPGDPLPRRPWVRRNLPFEKLSVGDSMWVPQNLVAYMRVRACLHFKKTKGTYMTKLDTVGGRQGARLTRLS